MPPPLPGHQGDGAGEARAERERLAEWMGRVEAKLDALMELSKVSSFSRQCSPASIPSRARRRGSEGSAKPLSLISLESAHAAPLPGPRLWMQELLARGRRATTSEEVEKKAARDNIEKTVASTSPEPEAERGATRERPTDDDEQAPPSPPSLALSPNNPATAQEACTGKADKDVAPSKDQELPALAATESEELPSSLGGNSPSRPRTSFSLPAKDDSRTRRRSTEDVLGEAEDQAQKVQKREDREARLSAKLQKKRTASASQLEFASAGPGPVRRVVTSPRFDICITFLIFGNALLIGAQVQDHATSSASPSWYSYVEHVCTGLFTGELVARVYVHRQDFFTSPTEWSWNLFDFFLVFISWVDICLTLISINSLPDSTAFVSKLGRSIRIVRILRIIRTARFLNQLRIMLKQLMSSMQSLFWVFVILAAVIYAVSIIITQSAVDYLIFEAPAVESELDSALLRQRFGTLFDTMYTLFQCISGGRSWGDASILMRGPGWVCEALVIVYVFFCVFAVANIVNGVFVDGAIELARRDRMHMIEKQRADSADKERHLVDLLMAIDQDGDNTITYEEWLEALERHEIRDYIAALQVETVDARALFTLLDDDGSGNVNVGEFVAGMIKLQGEAKSIDVHILLHENKKLISMMCGLMDFLYERSDNIAEDPATAA